MLRLGIDVGGTFTDLVQFDERTGQLAVTKVLTTPHHPSKGIMYALGQAALEPSLVGYLAQGGTTVINAVVERKGARTALVTTRGFRDVLEIGRGNRPDLYNLRFQPPIPFVERNLRFEVTERIGPNGAVLVPIDLADVSRVANQLRSAQVEAAAVCFLHAYRNPEHEISCAALLRSVLPGLAVTASHEMTREWREYERASTAVLNAYVQPLIQRYFDRLDRELDEAGYGNARHAMQSNGGTTSFAWARAHPITLLESGPAAGINGTTLVGKLIGECNLISLDVGGTTAKCAIVENGVIKVTTTYSIERTRVFPGYPVRVPVIDIVEIGAGGGSIAWFDASGMLHVGPASAGADPGPACYGRGGAEPTVTDAKLITGTLDAGRFAGGQLVLDEAAARQAMAKLAEHFGATIEEAAEAVIRLAEANMINALRLVSVQRGHDPRDFVLVASGGGGPMHAAILARELGVKKTVVPLYPGLFSAWGMLATAPRRDFSRTHLCPVAETRLEDLDSVFADMEREARAYFAAERSTPNLAFSHSVDMRYAGQEHVVRVLLAEGGQQLPAILSSFHTEHERTFTFRLDGTPVEFVTFHLQVEAGVARPTVRPLDSHGRSLAAACLGRRHVSFGEAGIWMTDVFDRDLLPADVELPGPAIIEEASSTTAVLPGQTMRVDEFGYLHIGEGA